MNNLFIHRSLTESKNTFLNGVLTSDIIYGDSGSFNFRNDIWTYPHETVFPMLYGEGYTIHEHLAPFGLVYLKELTGYFAEGPDIGTSGIYNNLSIDDDLGNVNSSIETGCNTHRQTDWVKDKPGQEAYFDKNVTSKDDPDLKGRIYVGKRIWGIGKSNIIIYGDENGNLSAFHRPIEIFGTKTKKNDLESDKDEFWNNPIIRTVVPDFITIGFGFNGIVGFGGGTSIEINWITRGPEASWKPVLTITQTIGGGYSIDATLNIGGAKYLGNANNIKRSMLQTNTCTGDLPTMWGSAGFTAGGKIGATVNYTPTKSGYGITSQYINIGVGLPAGPIPVNGAGGVSNTWILYDFYN